MATVPNIKQQQKMIVSKRFLCKISFDICCIIGCLYQIQTVISSYFQFSTVTRTTFYRASHLAYPNLHYCFMMIEDMLNLSAINLRYGTDFKRDNINYLTNQTNSLYRLFDVISVKDMFEFTPDMKISDCLYRDQTGNDIVQEEERTCDTFFKVKKYITQQYVCYAIRIRNQAAVSFHSIEKSLDRMIYEIRLSEIQSRHRKIRPTITSFSYPLFENVYAPYYYKRLEDNIAISVSCQNRTMHWLGYPYGEFACLPPDQGYNVCLDNCLGKETISTLNRLPFTSYYRNLSKNIDMKFISHTITQTLKFFFGKCLKFKFRVFQILSNGV